MKNLFKTKRNRIIVLCLSLVSMTAIFMDKKASAFPFIHVWVNGEEKTYELFAQQKSKQYANTDFSGAMQAAGKDYSASVAAQYAADTGVDHILRVWCGFFPLMVATCEVSSSALGVFVIGTDQRVLHKY